MDPKPSSQPADLDAGIWITCPGEPSPNPVPVPAAFSACGSYSLTIHDDPTITLTVAYEADGLLRTFDILCTVNTGNLTWNCAVPITDILDDGTTIALTATLAAPYRRAVREVEFYANASDPCAMECSSLKRGGVR